MSTVADPATRCQAFPPDVIPGILLGGSVNLFAGAANMGKTALLAAMLKQIRDGEPVFGHLPQPVPKIAVFSLDRAWHQSSQLWFDLVGFSDVPRYCLQDDFSFNVDRMEFVRVRMQIFREGLARLDPLPFGSLVVVDPIAPFLGGNLLHYDACMVACMRIRRLCLERGITLIGLSHGSKQKGDSKQRYVRLQDRIIGSMAQFGYTDTQMYLAGPEETGEEHYSFLWHSHVAPPEMFELGREKNGLFIPWDQSKAVKEQETLFELIPYLPDTIPWGELVIKAGEKGVSKTTAFRRLQEWTRAGIVLKVGRGLYGKPQPKA